MSFSGEYSGVSVPSSSFIIRNTVKYAIIIYLCILYFNLNLCCKLYSSLDLASLLSFLFSPCSHLFVYSPPYCALQSSSVFFDEHWNRVRNWPVCMRLCVWKEKKRLLAASTAFGLFSFSVLMSLDRIKSFLCSQRSNRKMWLPRVDKKLGVYVWMCLKGC